MTEPTQTRETADQTEVIAFLEDAATYGAGVAAVERIDTHASIVFLAGERAFKLKRAVRYPFLDYSTLERRRHCCEREVALNRRTAPRLYDGVVAVVRRTDGGLALGGSGTPADYLVAMRRIAPGHLFSELAQAGRLDPDLICAAVDAVIELHESAEMARPSAPSGGGAAGLHETISRDTAALEQFGALFGADTVAAYTAALEAAYRKVADLLDRRAAAGFVRHCHGDLHLANICLFEGRPTLFDAIEFNDMLAVIDTLYDFAFLLMDLDERGLGALANRAFNRYLGRISDPMAAIAGTRALPLMLAVRAEIRAVVAGLTAAKLDDEGDAGEAESARATARDYLAAAQRYLAPAPPVLVAVGGASGSGKSAVALAVAPEIGATPGALVLRSDEIRKQLAGLADAERLPPEAYTPEHHRAVYGEMYARAEIALAAGRSCVLDAVHGRPEERQRARELAAAAGASFTGVWLDVTEERLLERVASRRGDASDAGAEIVRRQLAAGFGDINWTRVDGGRSLDAVVGDVQALLVR